ncbi:MAG: SRPBCC domain-containing protein [Micropruina sp.]|uniref:SRPBCC family protein n=1 Tax=Micropruina sp. TaxID=2737536 RepID=UPI0039E3710B
MTEHGPIIEVTIAAPVEVVWPSLRDPALIRRWHGWHCAELDDEITMIFGTDQADDDTHTLTANGGDVFEVQAVDGGVRVRVTRAPYDPDVPWAAYYDDVTEGWTSFLQQLRFMHEQHPDEDRRTIFLMGRGAPGAVERLFAALPTSVGADWYTAERQRGVLLPELGPGLLLAVAKDAVRDDTGAEISDASAIVTCYGLDDAQFAAEQERWTAWWRQAYPEAPPAQV